MRRTKTKEDNKVEYGTVSLPKSLINLIKENIKGTGISSVSSYVAFILRQVLAAPNSSMEDKSDLEKEVRGRLKKLGYL